jgi:hypothetical protein
MATPALRLLGAQAPALCALAELGEVGASLSLAGRAPRNN